MDTLRRFLRDESAANMLEYALLAGMVAVALIAFVKPMRDAVGNLFKKITDAVNAAP